MGEPDYAYFRRAIPLLADVADGDVKVLLRSAKLTKLAPRSVLAVEGKPADTAFMLMKGRVRLSRAHKHGIPTIMGDLGPGGVVGVIGLLDTGDYVNTAEAVSEVTALGIDRSKLYALGAAGEAGVYRLIRCLGPAVVDAVRRSLGRVDALFKDPSEGVVAMERLILASSRRR